MRALMCLCLSKLSDADGGDDIDSRSDARVATTTASAVREVVDEAVLQQYSGHCPLSWRPCSVHWATRPPPRAASPLRAGLQWMLSITIRGTSKQ